MNRKFIGVIFIFIAFQLIAMAIAGFHGHYRPNPYKDKDWLFCGAVAILAYVGVRLLSRKRVKKNQVKQTPMNKILLMNSRRLFKLIVFCCTGFYVPIGILRGLLAAFEIVPATLNDEQYAGVMGLTISILFISAGPLFFTLERNGNTDKFKFSSITGDTYTEEVIGISKGWGLKIGIGGMWFGSRTRF